MKSELSFLGKIIRNGLILAGLYLVSVWASTSTIAFQTYKPVLIFLFTYILTELIKHYKIDRPETKIKPTTLIF